MCGQNPSPHSFEDAVLTLASFDVTSLYSGSRVAQRNQSVSVHVWFYSHVKYACE